MIPQSDRPLFVPTIPDGVTFFSLVAVTHALSGNTSKSVTSFQLFGCATPFPAAPFAQCLYRAQAKRCIPESNSLLERGTLFGFYSSAMSMRQAHEWRMTIRPKRFQGRNTRSFIPTSSQRNLAKYNMYRCTACMEVDVCRYGLAYWHTIHQVPGIHHCPIHGLPLLGACNACGRSQGSNSDWHLPQPSCPHCGNGQFDSRSTILTRGYLRHLDLTSELFSSNRRAISPTRRMALYRRAFATERKRYPERIIRSLLRDWECTSLRQLSNVVGAEITPAFVERAITGNDGGVNPIGQLVLVALARASVS
ncbi:hypothetical protein BSE24067_04198 [Burkholderia seminalis]|nr:hypothetical protein BSE24067_04198 [Burkholderia seminalis]